MRLSCSFGRQWSTLKMLLIVTKTVMRAIKKTMQRNAFFGYKSARMFKGGITSKLDFRSRAFLAPVIAATNFIMKFILLVAACLIVSVYGEAELNIEDNGKYNFLYSVEDAGAHKRQESSNGDGTVSGSYSYVDANGDLRKVEYKAGGSIGFQPSGDISVDKKTAEKAEEIAALAPKATAVETAEVKIPASPFTLPLYAMPGIHAPAHVLHHPLALPYAYLHRPLFVL